MMLQPCPGGETATAFPVLGLKQDNCDKSILKLPASYVQEPEPIFVCVFTVLVQATIHKASGAVGLSFIEPSPFQ